MSARGPAPARGRAVPVRGRRRLSGRLVPARLPGGSRAAGTRPRSRPGRGGQPARRSARRAGASVPGRGGALPLRLALRAPLRRQDEHGLDERLRQGPDPRALPGGGADPAGARRSGRGRAGTGPSPRLGVVGAADPGRGGDPRQDGLVPARRTGRTGDPAAAPGARPRWAAGALPRAGRDRARMVLHRPARLAHRAAAGGPPVRPRHGRPGRRVAGPARIPGTGHLDRGARARRVPGRSGHLVPAPRGGAPRHRRRPPLRPGP